MEHSAAFLSSHRLNPRGSAAACKTSAVCLTRPPNLAMMDVAVFEVEVGSASSPTSSLCISGGFVRPVWVLGRQGGVSLSLRRKGLVAK